MPPVKKYTSTFPQVPATELERLSLTLLANEQGRSITDVLREAYRKYLARPDVAAELSKLKALKGDE